MLLLQITGHLDEEASRSTGRVQDVFFGPRVQGLDEKPTDFSRCEVPTLLADGIASPRCQGAVLRRKPLRMIELEELGWGPGREESP
jgi:hypothetical protein